MRSHRYFLVKFIKDAESRNELHLAFGFSILFGCYIALFVISFTTRETKKLTLKLNFWLKIIIMQQQQQQQKPISINPYIQKKPEKKKYRWCEHDLVLAIKRYRPPLNQSVTIFIWGAIFWKTYKARYWKRFDI